MRLRSVLLCLAGTALAAQHLGLVPASQGPALNWTFGLQRTPATLTLKAQGSKDGRATLVDSEADLGLHRQESPLGGFVEYSGRTHAFALTYDRLKQAGDQALPRDILLDGTAYAAGTPLRSRVDATVLGLLYTYKFLNRGDAWLGLDLAVQGVRTDLTADSLGSLPTHQVVHPSYTLPQVGLTGWSSGVGGLLESRVYYRTLAWKGATTTRYGIDARAYLYPRFGLRAFWESATLRVPPGSLEGDLDLRLESKTSGFGLVIRF